MSSPSSKSDNAAKSNTTLLLTAAALSTAIALLVGTVYYAKKATEASPSASPAAKPASKPRKHVELALEGADASASEANSGSKEPISLVVEPAPTPLESEASKPSKSDEDLARRFEAAVLHATKSSSKLSGDVKLTLFALHKQATEGDHVKRPQGSNGSVAGGKPGAATQEAAWAGLRGMSYQDAQQGYIATLFSNDIEYAKSVSLENATAAASASTATGPAPVAPTTPRGEAAKSSRETRSALVASEGALGSTAYSTGDFQAAVEHFTRALELSLALSNEENNPETRKILHQNRAAAREKLGDLAGVVADASAALEIDPLHRRALVRRARAYEKSGEAQLALDDATLLGALDRELDRRAQMADPNAREHEPDEVVTAMKDRLTQTLGVAAANQLWSERATRAVTGFENLPKASYVRGYWYHFSELARGLKEPPAKQAVADAVVEAGKQTSESAKGDAALEIGLMLKLRGEFEAAAERFEFASTRASTKKKRAAALSEIGSMHHLCGNPRVAKEKFLAALKSDPESVVTYVKLAALALEEGDREECQRLFDAAEKVVVDQGDAATPFDRADLHLHLGQFAERREDLELAKSHMEKAIEHVPDFALAHMHRGVVLFRMGIVEESLVSLSKACELAWENPEVHNYHGEVLMSVKRIDEAMKKFNDATTIDATCILPLLNRGSLLLSPDNPPAETESLEDRVHQAFELYDHAINVDPTCEVARVQRATLYFSVADYESALEDYRAAVAMCRTKLELTEHCASLALVESEVRIKPRLIQAGLAADPASAKEA